MGRPSSQILTVWAKEALRGDQWVLLNDVIIEGIKKNFNEISETELYEIAAQNLDYVADNLRNEVAEWKIDGKIPIFDIDDQTTPYIKSLENKSQQVLLHLRKISPLNFEIFCAKILKALGAEQSTHTSTNMDGGIDFQAIKMNIVASSLNVPDGCKAAVIGQAKRYKDGNMISETAIREFVGAATLRHHELQIEGTLKRFSPAIFAFWTTSDFDQNARKFARNLGLWHMDGRTFANYVIELSLDAEVFALPEYSQGLQKTPKTER